MNEVNSNRDCAERILTLAENFDLTDFNLDEDDTIPEYEIKNIESSLVNYDIKWIKDWLYDIKAEINSRIDREDADYIGHNLVECDILLNYLELLNKKKT